MWKQLVYGSVVWFAMFLAVSVEGQVIEISVTPELPTPYDVLTVHLKAEPLPLAVIATRREGFQLIVETHPICNTICVPPPPILEVVEFGPTLQGGIFEIRVEEYGVLLASREIEIQGHLLYASMPVMAPPRVKTTPSAASPK